MTDDNHDDDRDPFQAAFDDYRRAPRDVVHRGMTTDALVDLDNRCAGDEVVHYGGRMILDGTTPVGMEPGEDYHGELAGCVIDLATVRKLGLTAEQLPNVRILDLGAMQ